MKRNLFIFIMLLSVICLADFGGGEELTFDIGYGLIRAGSVKMEVSESVWHDSIATYVVSSRAKTTRFFDGLYKVRDLIEIEFDQRNYQSYRYHKKLREGSYRQNRISLFYPELGYSVLHKKDKKAKKWTEKKYDIPVPSHDIFTTFFMVRSFELTPGDTIQVTVTDDGDINTVDVIIHRKLKMKTIFGKIDCFELEPVLKGTDSIFKNSGNIYIYLTADENKIPVLLKSEVIFGSFKATLNSYKPAKK